MSLCRNHRIGVSYFVFAVSVCEQLAAVTAFVVFNVSVGCAGFRDIIEILHIVAERISVFDAAGFANSLIRAGRITTKVFLIVKLYGAEVAVFADVPVCGFVVVIAVVNIRLAKIEHFK